MDVIIKRSFLRLSIFLLWTSGLTDGSHVTQMDTLWQNQGKDATMNCSHTKGAGYYQMYWYRQLPGETMKLIVFTTAGNKDHDFGDFKKEKFSATKPDAESGTFTVKDVQPEDNGLYFCAVSEGYSGGGAQADFGGGTKLTVVEDGLTITPPTVQVLRPSSKECGNDDAPKKTIVCVASGFYPDHVSVSWQVDGEAVTTGVATDNAALREDDFYKITSRLRVSTKNWFNPETVFTCTVSFYNGTHTETYSDSLHGEEGGGMTREKYLRSTQTAKLSYGVLIIKSSIYGACVAFLVWKLQRSAGKQNH